MNHLGLRCNVSGSRGTIMAIISTSEGEIHRFVYRSPSVFSFKHNSGEILNWHRENILSLITFYDIKGISIKKGEINEGRLNKAGIFKLYLEGVLLSLAGTIGLYNRHYYKNDIKVCLEDSQIFEKSIEDIAQQFGKTLMVDNLLATEREVTKEAILSVLALEKQNGND